MDVQTYLSRIGFAGPAEASLDVLRVVHTARRRVRCPVSLETSDPQEQGHRVYPIRKDIGVHFLEWQREENRGADRDWLDICKFTLEPRCLEDFAEMRQYHQSSPCSIFFCRSLCTVLRPGGRLTYIGRRLISATFPTEGTGVLETTTREHKNGGDPSYPSREIWSCTKFSTHTKG